MDRVRARARAAGLVRIGVTSTEPFTDARVELERRRDLGLHAGMAFTFRNPERSTEPGLLLPGARSILVAAWPYAGGRSGNPPVTSDPSEPPGTYVAGTYGTSTYGTSGRPQGRVARYATEDHYGQLREALAAVAGVLHDDGYATRVVIDDNGLVDRAAAHRAGVGWFGHNANILVPGHGSWVVLGSIVTDADLGTSDVVADGCGTCRRCLDGCPTGAIVAPGVVDARRCLAWLVQAPGSIPEEYRVAMADRVYGCDDCQEVCPPSRRGPQGNRPPSSAQWVDLLDMVSASDDELLARFGRWYIADRDPRHLRRNALVALGNTAHPDDGRVRRHLQRFAAGEDGMLAEHARWALARLDERRFPA